MAINAMGVDAMENTVIPLVINQTAGQEFRINMFTSTIPDPNVYLEDAILGTFTNLYEEDFILNPISDLEGAGRFFIHLSQDTFSTDDEFNTNLLNVFKLDRDNFITLEGLALQSNKTNVKLFNLIGTEVLSTSLSNNTNTQTIPTDGLASGVYVIKLQSANNQLTKKLIIK